MDNNKNCGVWFQQSEIVLVWGARIFTYKEFIARHGSDLHERFIAVDHATFCIHRPFGIETDELQRTCFNLGAQGGTLLAMMLEEIDDKQVDALFENSSDREEFWLWAETMSHLSQGTIPASIEKRGEISVAWKAHAPMLAMLGIPAPRWILDNKPAPIGKPN